MTPPAGRWTTTLNFPFASGMRRTSLSLWTRARKDTAPRAPRRGPSESLLVVRCDLRPKDHVERSRPCRTIEIRGAHPPRGRHDTTRDTVALARLRHHRSGRRRPRPRPGPDPEARRHPQHAPHRGAARAPDPRVGDRLERLADVAVLLGPRPLRSRQ